MHCRQTGRIANLTNYAQISHFQQSVIMLSQHCHFTSHWRGWYIWNTLIIKEFFSLKQILDYTSILTCKWHNSLWWVFKEGFTQTFFPSQSADKVYRDFIVTSMSIKKTVRVLPKSMGCSLNTNTQQEPWAMLCEFGISEEMFPITGLVA